MSDLADLKGIPPIQVFDGVRLRRVQGDLMTLAVVELDPNAVVPEHRHPNEQHGMVITGQMDFRVGDERRTLGPGGTWRIGADVPHEAHAGPDGAVVIDVFSPIRADWDTFPTLDPTAPVWPGR
ncbi:MAG: cupin domain-containing protein [Chloroflexota bacterium]|nr:cupin domain-containing protein [Chloroflexota bacterium]